MKIALYIITVISLFVSAACSNLFSESDAVKYTLAKIHELDDPHLNIDFPKRNGTRTVKVTIGGMYGNTTSLKLTTSVKLIDKETYEVTLIKDWNYKVNDIRVISFWVFKVTQSNVTLLRKDDKDDLLAAIG
ncbi:hypothetical protein PAECIP111891_02116 [Paenibacillus allorhizoplanae]|uniref:DUF3888 domain-containing protein n=1 Tax=Paenibacillus allorhizoplanae TaxID=2905648 RepID=A0ABN8GGC2_9BACL|nr:hypothetical protein [Paenibacillus allorhizoplanae]CAH1202287.1 hypothetical protein PAECIP111891_02116 [Paenibacillus allorhizoplanae]